MKNKFLVWLSVIVFSFSIGKTFADRYGLNKTPKELEDYFWTLSDKEQDGILNNAGGLIQNIIFYGYSTRIYLKAIEGTISFWGNWQINDSTQTISTSLTGYSETYSDTFYVPRSSPTIVTFTLSAGSSCQYMIGGMKK